MTGINRAERRGDSGALSLGLLPQLFLLLHLPSSSSALLHSELFHGFIKTPKVASLSTALISKLNFFQRPRTAGECKILYIKTHFHIQTIWVKKES